MEAHTAKHFLEANGIPAFVLDEYSSESWWNTVDVKIQVPADQAQDAMAFTLVSATPAALPWTRWSRRFTLRTLLIATTLVAVVLGLIVWLR
jgi:hypothetical protein